MDYRKKGSPNDETTEIDLLMSTDWYRAIVLIALVVQVGMFVVFAIAGLYSYFNGQVGSAIFLVLLASILRPSIKW